MELLELVLALDLQPVAVAELLVAFVVERERLPVALVVEREHLLAVPVEQEQLVPMEVALLVLVQAPVEQTKAVLLPVVVQLAAAEKMVLLTLAELVPQLVPVV